MKRLRHAAGFTLLEIMIVVTIIALLLSAAIYKMSPSIDFAKSTRIQGDLQSLKTSLLAYSGKTGFYPTTEQGLQALVSRPTTDPIPEQWMQLMDSVPKDPWGMPYIYKCPGIKHPTTYDLYCSGADRVPDTDDDQWVP
jgi:general secretion pathway protein G